MGRGWEPEGADADSRVPLFQRAYDWSATAASMATLTALGTLEEVDPVELSDVFGTTLYDHVDPEALDTLVASDGHVTLSFLIDDYWIRIDGEELTITRQKGHLRAHRDSFAPVVSVCFAPENI